MRDSKNAMQLAFVEDLEHATEVMDEHIALLENEKQESLEELFRVFHSLKSSTRVLHYQSVSDFFHQGETLLSQIKNHQIKMTPKIIAFFFQINDILKKFKENVEYKNYLEEDFNRDLEWQENFTNLKNQIPIYIKEKLVQKTLEKDYEKFKTYLINLKFDPDIFLTGSDPLIYIEDIFKKTEVLKIKSGSNAVPLLQDLNPECYYFQWQMEVKTNLSITALLEIFAFLDPEKNQIQIHEIELTNPSMSMNSGLKKQEIKQIDWVRVHINKLDEVLNLFGELVVGFAQINEILNRCKDEKAAAVSEIFTNSLNHLREKIINIRMVSLAPLFNQFYRFTNELAEDLGKKAVLRISGEETELDKNIVDKIREPLLHLIRNCLDHGLEPPEERIKLGKTATGNIFIDAFHREGEIYIMVSDDGRGLNKDEILRQALEKKMLQPNELKHLSDEEIYQFIFYSGFTTKRQVSEVSGRGIGMDVVKQNIGEIRGAIEIQTQKNKGTTFILKLPATLAIIDLFHFKTGNDLWALPVFYVKEIVRQKNLKFTSYEGILPAITHKDEKIPVFFLEQVLNANKYQNKNFEQGTFFLLEVEKTQFFMFVDEIVSQQQSVIKKIPQLEPYHSGILGSTILANGEILFILDIFILFKQIKDLRLSKVSGGLKN